MKLSLLSNVLLASMMVFAVSCGKDSKKKSNNPYYGFYNPMMGGQVITGQTAKNNLNTYVNAVEPKVIYSQIIIKKKSWSCSTRDFLGINFLPYEKCSSTDLPDFRGYAQQGQTRVTINSFLGELLTPAAGYTLGNVYQQGPYIFVDHVSSNGYDTVQYAVDTNQHAHVNPIQIKNTELKKIDYVYSSNI
jgi:hypothetical protein